MAMAARLKLSQPFSKRRLIALHMGVQCMGTLDEQLPQIAVPSFADAVFESQVA